MDAEMRELAAEMRSGFSAVNQRISEVKADLKADLAEKHNENRPRFARIEEQVLKTNGRVSILETSVDWLRGKVRDLGRKRGDDSDGELQNVTLGDLKWYLLCVGGGFGAAMGLLKLMGKL